MTIKKVLRMGNPLLRLEAKELSKEEILSNETSELIQDMIDTMKHEGGIGIAAPQIGVSKQAAIIEIGEDNPRYPGLNGSGRFIIFNPIIEFLTQDLQGYWEGCLSVPGLRGFVERPSKIKISYIDQATHSQEIILEGFLATVFQHELDHLFGTLYVDRITDKSKLSFEEEYVNYWTKN